MTPHGDDELSPGWFEVEAMTWLDDHATDPVSELAVMLFYVDHTDAWLGDEAPPEWEENLPLTEA